MVVDADASIEVDTWRRVMVVVFKLCNFFFFFFLVVAVVAAVAASILTEEEEVAADTEQQVLVVLSRLSAAATVAAASILRDTVPGDSFIPAFNDFKDAIFWAKEVALEVALALTLDSGGKSFVSSSLSSNDMASSELEPMEERE